MNTENNEVIERLKKTTIEEIIQILITNMNISNYEPHLIAEKTNKNIYSINELLEEYPMFSRYSLERAVKEKGLPFLKLGNKKFFEKDAVDKWIEENNTTVSQKKRYDLL